MGSAVKTTLDKRWLIFTVTGLGTFMATLDASIVNVALPEIARLLQVQLYQVQWVVSAYLLVISALLPLFGKLGDAYGRRSVYLLGMSIFAVGSLLCGLANSIWLLVAARAVQAIGAAMLMSNAPAIVSTTFQGAQRGRALGLNGAIVAIGSLTGPSLGGILVGAFSWQSIFYINIPIAIGAVLYGCAILPKETQKSNHAFDYVGAALFAIAMTSLLLAISHGQEWGWQSVRVLMLSLTALLGFGLFFRQERRVTQPMIELNLFKNWTLLSGNISGMLSFMALFANNILLPFYLQRILQLAPAQIGLAIMPFPLLLAVTAPISGYLSEKVNPANLTTAGLLITMGGLLQLTLLTETTSVWQIVVNQAVLGIGNGLFQSPNNNSVLSAAPQDKVGLVSGINALVRNVGMVCGVAIAVSVFESRSRQFLASVSTAGPAEQTAAFLAGYHVAMFVAACFAAVGVAISFNRRSRLRTAPSGR